MRPMKILTVIGFLALTGAAPSSPSTTQVLMRQKLEATHGLLEGIVREDFTMIQKHAETLDNISKATTWHKQDDQSFLVRAKTFQNSVTFLSEQARAKNLEGVAIGYMRVTLDCMQCHNFVREGRAK